MDDKEITKELERIWRRLQRRIVEDRSEEKYGDIFRRLERVWVIMRNREAIILLVILFLPLLKEGI